MSIEKLYNEIEYVSAIVREAETFGMKLEVSTDFEHLQWVVSNNDDKTPLYPMFNTSSSFISPANGFWVKGTDDTGEVVHVQGLRLLDLGENTLLEHLREHRYKYVVQGDFTVPDEKLFAASPAANRISGKTVYHGQIWLKGGENGSRGQGISALLPRYALAMSLLQWSPDYIFGYVDPKLGCRGVLAQYGYYHFEPERWWTPDGTRSHEHWMCWAARDDVSHMMQLSATDMFRLMAPQTQPAPQAPEAVPKYQTA